MGEPIVGPADLDPMIVARARECAASVVILPLREVDGIGIYTEPTLTLGKRLRAEGVGAVYLHDQEHRRFEAKKGVVFGAAEAFLIGIAGNAAWDAIKTLLFRGKDRQVELTYLELEDGKGAAWKAVGETEAVVQALDALRSRETTPRSKNVTTPAPQEIAERDFEASGFDDDLREAHVRGQILQRRRQAESLRAAAERALTSNPPDMANAELQARRALGCYARSLDWAEDTEDEDEAHRLMDEAGAWVRTTFGCWIQPERETYKQTCPVALAHNRLGLSIGGSAIRFCSLCGEDLSECAHLPGVAYMVPGGSTELGWCRVCLAETCDHSTDELYRVSVVAMIKDLEVEEVSLVSKPKNPEARILQISIPVSELQEEFGDDFVPGMPISCDRCLQPCEGLIKHDRQGAGESHRGDGPSG